jgi:hypothetical protein
MRRRASRDAGSSHLAAITGASRRFARAAQHGLLPAVGPYAPGRPAPVWGPGAFLIAAEPLGELVERCFAERVDATETCRQKAQVLDARQAAMAEARDRRQVGWDPSSRRNIRSSWRSARSKLRTISTTGMTTGSRSIVRDRTWLTAPAATFSRSAASASFRSPAHPPPGAGFDGEAEGTDHHDVGVQGFSLSGLVQPGPPRIRPEGPVLHYGHDDPSRSLAAGADGARRRCRRRRLRAIR